MVVHLHSMLSRARYRQLMPCAQLRQWISAIGVFVFLLILSSPVFAQTGDLQVNCPPRATIRVDDVEVGTCPTDGKGLFVGKLGVGSHRVTAILNGGESHEKQIMLTHRVLSVVDFGQGETDKNQIDKEAWLKKCKEVVYVSDRGDRPHQKHTWDDQHPAYKKWLLTFNEDWILPTASGGSRRVSLSLHVRYNQKRGLLRGNNFKYRLTFVVDGEKAARIIQIGKMGVCSSVKIRLLDVQVQFHPWAGSCDSHKRAIAVRRMDCW